jgi:hypothetical protein
MSPTPCRRGAIELKRAELILRALNTAVGNIKRVKFDLHAHEMVREIPNNPAPPTEEVDEAARRANRAESARPTAAYLAECRAELEKQSPHAGAKHGNPTNITPTSGKRKYESSDTLHATAGVWTAKVPPVHVGTATRLSRRPRIAGLQRSCTQANTHSSSQSHRPQAHGEWESRSSKGAKARSLPRKLFSELN